MTSPCVAHFYGNDRRNVHLQHGICGFDRSAVFVPARLRGAGRSNAKHERDRSAGLSPPRARRLSDQSSSPRMMIASCGHRRWWPAQWPSCVNPLMILSLSEPSMSLWDEVKSQTMISARYAASDGDTPAAHQVLDQGPIVPRLRRNNIETELKTSIGTL
jgi:hypothetical protein